LVGENGELLVDTTKTDMDHVDKILIGVKSKKKQLEKLLEAGMKKPAPDLNAVVPPPAK